MDEQENTIKAEFVECDEGSIYEFLSSWKKVLDDKQKGEMTFPGVDENFVDAMRETLIKHGIDPQSLVPISVDWDGVDLSETVSLNLNFNYNLLEDKLDES
jgi:kynurenine formamidase